MHPQLSPVAAHMRLDELATRQLPRHHVVPVRRSRWTIGRRRAAGRSPTLPVAPVIGLTVGRRAFGPVPDQRVA